MKRDETRDEYRAYQEKRQERRLHKRRIYPHYKGDQPLLRLYELAPEAAAPGAAA